MKWTRTLASLKETEALGLALGSSLPAGCVIALDGDLGAGKTTLTQSIARGLGIPEAVAIQSPTYTLVKRYTQGRIPLNHMDLYRLSHPDELIELGFEELVDDEALTVIEWAQRFPEEIPAEGIWFYLSWMSPDARRLEVKLEGAGAPLLAILEGVLGEGEAAPRAYEAEHQ